MFKKKKKSKDKRKFPTLPPKISFTEFITESSEEAADSFAQSMIDQGFVILTLDGGDAKEDIERYFAEGARFFGEQDFEEKEKLEKKHELWSNRKANKGYIHVKDVKEYLKLSLVEEEYPTHPDTLKPAFDKVFSSLNEIAKRGLGVLSTYKVDGTPYIKEDIYAHLQRKVDEKSSISLIHYFAAAEDGTPSNEHVDTGLLTLIICAQVPGLQVKDRLTEQWLEVEKMVTPGVDMFIIMGKKMELLANVHNENPLFKATFHQVALPNGTERSSLLFFLDVKA